MIKRGSSKQGPTGPDSRSLDLLMPLCVLLTACVHTRNDDMAEHGMYSRNPEPWTQHRGFAVLGFGAALDTIDRTQGNQTLPMFARIRRISLGETAKVSSNFLSCMFSVTGRANLYEALVLDRVAWLTLKSLRIGAQ